jgi:hypothetical protein
VQQVSKADSIGKLYSHPASSRRASLGAPPSKQNCPPPQPRAREEATISSTPNRNRQNQARSAGVEAARPDAHEHINELQAA